MENLNLVKLKRCRSLEEYVWLNGGLVRLSDLRQARESLSVAWRRMVMSQTASVGFARSSVR
jgi:hypothetical protein